MAQIIPIMFYPILAKIYLPEEFGFVSSLMTIATFISVVASLRYESAIFIANSKEEAINIFIFVLTLSGAMILIISLPLLFFSNKLFTILEYYNYRLGYFIFLCPIIAYSLIVYNCYNEWCVKNDSFKLLSYNKITNSAFTVISKLLFGIITFFKHGLILGELFGRFFSALFSFYKFIKEDGVNITFLRRDQFVSIAKKYIKFPKYTLLDQIISQLISAFPIIFIGFYFNFNDVGYFVMSMNILSLPVSVISLSISDVFRNKIVDAINKNLNCKVIYLKMLKILSFSSVLLIILLYFIIPKVFDLFLGETWDKSKIFALLLLPSTIIGLISMSLSGVLIATNNNKISLIWQFIYLFLVLMSFFIGLFYFNDIYLTIAFFSIARAIAYILYIYYSYKSTNEIYI
jgi:O-antigen/teichoic acid export membrane protein